MCESVFLSNNWICRIFEACKRSFSYITTTEVCALMLRDERGIFRILFCWQVKLYIICAGIERPILDTEPSCIL